MAKLNKGIKLWNKAKKIIPGGGMLLSKKPEMFAPDLWPTYFTKSNGCFIWDLDNKKFMDMSLMGVGTNILGYNHPEVNDAVLKTVNKGNLTTLNCPEEVFLASKLIELHPWADMAKFARTGGEANAIAIRIARASSGKDNVAICGYHGWSDWYLAANLKTNKNLSNHLFDGLNPKGVPKKLKNTVFPFEYNNFEQLRKIIKTKNIGVVKMEVSRNFPPENNFLQKIREITTKNNIVLIFDECSSGFRRSNGGLHKYYKVNPDIAVFGKALGNGYAITAVIGKKNIMNFAQDTFISSTFWTERIGPTAALKTLEVMKKTKSWEKITKIGEEIQESWKKIAEKNGLDINISGQPAISSFSFNSKNNLKYKTLITQEFLKKNILATNLLFISTAHKKENIDLYLYHLDKIFKLIAKCEDGLNINDLLKTRVCYKGFRRIN
ncbi:aminotransferase class III-fold pyridoxal phosphate-dependent enzyme [Candidatus Pelagibacter sp.]|jgi:glutamate-1-semialdehyde 2,1-aminomutase|nr:aminotransferase class III-fold pyridoxal phosphate-dependent enzyme [Candidatus Pelagibacter sp.]